MKTENKYGGKSKIFGNDFKIRRHILLLAPVANGKNLLPKEWNALFCILNLLYNNKIRNNFKKTNIVIDKIVAI
jgi:hypothetical protein